MALRAWYGIWFGLASMLWYIVWPGRHHMLYGMSWRTRMVYSMALRASHGIMVWPGWTWHGTWYGLAGIAWYMVWPGGHHMIYGYGLPG